MVRNSRNRALSLGRGIPLVLAMAWGLALSSASAQMEGERRRSLTAVGRSERFVAPDVAWLTLAVESRHKVAGQAVADNARRMQEVMTRLRSQIGPQDKLYTLGYELFPYYDETQIRPRRMRGAMPPALDGPEMMVEAEMKGSPGKEMAEGAGKFPEILGYVVRNRIQLETGSLQGLGALIDAAIAAGADRVEGLSFAIRQESYRQELLQEAIRKAREEAEVLAKALGVKLVRVLQATPNVISPMPRRRPFLMMEARPALVPTPIEPEEVRVMAEVTVIYEIE
ncbi:MAG: SIMPL domain-containing protein [Candidatus Tectomicrobia bacterium]|uniref:SIMPL domain-containing protein n=1 Tax=Tectimicrobiota bacterium TaxID=2528274 RepID=A0A932CQD9_UNCTE|nr:SIMPL domain-containing protein [Candidatus Tectomicrobia bacterium]